MEMTYAFSDDSSMNKIMFEGLTGREYVTSTKEALKVMKIRNPAIGFTFDAKSGRFDDISDEEYDQILATITCVQNLWHYPGDLPNKIQRDMNILTLLANAIELISKQDVELRSYRKKGEKDE